ncbi:AAA family ATPase [Schnuerera ultunensis]|uniref:Adenylate cyclase / Guanylate cyclase n=1 Tax=[Clostridium] ultunense Esp TaxID=1288971 RepID=A0A1M4PLM4_9FIRM|nr:AAA family ATPase [Schnuerera ultunensis]SHD76374.1 Adenylate cyclase / Guanylate cyclase [[Clostridium] ultunense Esp]
MTIIKAKLFGTPKVEIDNQLVFFPYGKAEALFYYILLKKQVSREILVELLWSDVNESLGKKSLRNAVYVIKKTFNEDVLVSPKRTLIMLNPNIKYETDIELFLSNDSNDAINYYKGEFLEGFYVNDANNFEQWMFDLKYTYKDKYIKKLYNEISICLDSGKITQAEKYCKTLTNTDPFDERAYRILLDIYRKQGRYNECIDEYNKLANLLEKELSLSPDGKTKQLLESIIKEKNQVQKINRDREKGFFYGREDEMKILNNNFYGFINNIESRSIIVIGEAGIGKSKLIDRFLELTDENDANILISNCYQAEESFLLKPWFELSKQLATIIEKEKIEIPEMLKKIVGYIFPIFISHETIKDINPIEEVDFLKYQVAEKALLDIFEKVSYRKKMVIIFEDVQWIDRMSLMLIKNILFQNKNKSIQFIITCRNGYLESIEDFLTEVAKFKLIERLELESFDESETIEFVSKYLPDHELNPKTKKLIYKETEGNPLFIIELLNSIKENRDSSLTTRMQDVLRSRFLNVSKDGKNILNIISIYFDRVTFNELLMISGKDEFELSEIIEELQDRHLIKEIITSDGDIAITFTHQKLREYIYNQLSYSKKRILHNKVGKHLEGQLKNRTIDRLLYSKLIYHFENAGNKASALEYRIKNLYDYLQINDEIFPIIDYKGNSQNINLYITEKQLIEELGRINILLRDLKEEYFSDEDKLKELQLAYFHMVGRHFIVSGEYGKGLSIVEEMIAKSIKFENYNFALKGYLLIIYYSINVYDTVLMNHNITRALSIAKKLHNKGEIGVILRMKGYQKVLEGNFIQGEKYLKNSISIFNSLEDRNKYILNIAAANYYIGESNKLNGKFLEAISYYEKAISICEEYGLVERLTVFKTSAGQAAYDMGNYDMAEKYLRQALMLYDQLDFHWGRTIAHGYTALLLMRQQNYIDVVKHLKKADKYAQRLKNPYEVGITFRVKAEICSLVKTGKVKNDNIYKYLEECGENFCEKAIFYLSNISKCYEIEVMRSLKEICKNC